MYCTGMAQEVEDVGLILTCCMHASSQHPAPPVACEYSTLVLHGSAPWFAWSVGVPALDFGLAHSQPFTLLLLHMHTLLCSTMAWHGTEREVKREK